nr:MULTISPECIES: hypothetical protein [Burkholderia]
MTEREPESHARRPLAFTEQFARGVVDRRDVVGVKRMPHAQRVRRHAGADAEGSGADTEMVRNDERKQRTPADDVQNDDEHGDCGQ